MAHMPFSRKHVMTPSDFEIFFLIVSPKIPQYWPLNSCVKRQLIRHSSENIWWAFFFIQFGFEIYFLWNYYKNTQFTSFPVRLLNGTLYAVFTRTCHEPFFLKVLMLKYSFWYFPTKYLNINIEVCVWNGTLYAIYTRTCDKHFSSYMCWLWAMFSIKFPWKYFNFVMFYNSCIEWHIICHFHANM